MCCSADSSQRLSGTDALCFPAGFFALVSRNRLNSISWSSDLQKTAFFAALVGHCHPWPVPSPLRWLVCTTNLKCRSFLIRWPLRSCGAPIQPPRQRNRRSIHEADMTTRTFGRRNFMVSSTAALTACLAGTKLRNSEATTGQSVASIVRMGKTKVQ